MKESQGLPRALEFEHMEAPSARMDGQRCLTRKLYAVAGRTGIFRRMPRTGQSLRTTRPGAFLAVFDGTIVELLRDPAAERELLAAHFSPIGYTDTTRAGPDLHPLRQPPRPGDDSSEADQLRRAGLAAAEDLNRAGQQAQDPAPPEGRLEPQARRYPAEGPGGEDEGKTAAEILAEQGQRAP